MQKSFDRLLLLNTHSVAKELKRDDLRMDAQAIFRLLKIILSQYLFLPVSAGLSVY